MDQNNNNQQGQVPQAQPIMPQPATSNPMQQTTPVTSTAPAATPSPELTQPAAPTPPTGITPPHSSHSKLLIIGIVVLILVLGGLSYVLFMNSNNSTPPVQTTAVAPTVIPTVTTAPTATPTPDLKSQAEQIDTGDPEADLSNLQTDVSGL